MRVGNRSSDKIDVLFLIICQKYISSITIQYSIHPGTLRLESAPIYKSVHAGAIAKTGTDRSIIRLRRRYDAAASIQKVAVVGRQTRNKFTRRPTSSFYFWFLKNSIVVTKNSWRVFVNRSCLFLTCLCTLRRPHRTDKLCFLHSHRRWRLLKNPGSPRPMRQQRTSVDVIK